MCLAVPGRVIEVTCDEPFERTGRVDFGGVVKSVDLTCVPEAGMGDYVIVHVGMALAVLDESEAESVLDALRELHSVMGGEGR